MTLHLKNSTEIFNLSGSIDFILEREHPQWDAIRSGVAHPGTTLVSCEAAQWQAAIGSGNADWLVLADRRAAVTAADFLGVEQHLAAAKTPLWLQPLTMSSAAKRFVGEQCAAAVSLCWNNPALDSLVCVRRAGLAALPAMTDGHSDAIWDWLIRAGGRPGVLSQPASSDGAANGELSQDQLRSLVSRPALPEQHWLIAHIQRAKPSQFVPEKKSEADSVAVKAGLLLWHDAADASHQLSQSIEGLGQHQAGDYWHAITHRREPDYSNAKYWFRHLGEHPVFAELRPYAEQALQNVADGDTWNTRLSGTRGWDPFAFIDLCAACEGREDSPLGLAARRIQTTEMQLLIVSAWRDASGHSLTL